MTPETSQADRIVDWYGRKVQDAHARLNRLIRNATEMVEMIERYPDLLTTSHLTTNIEGGALAVAKIAGEAGVLRQMHSMIPSDERRDLSAVPAPRRPRHRTPDQWRALYAFALERKQNAERCYRMGIGEWSHSDFWRRMHALVSEAMNGYRGVRP